MMQAGIFVSLSMADGDTAFFSLFFMSLFYRPLFISPLSRRRILSYFGELGNTFPFHENF